MEHPRAPHFVAFQDERWPDRVRENGAGKDAAGNRRARRRAAAVERALRRRLSLKERIAAGGGVFNG